MDSVFKSRRDAGRVLAAYLRDYADRDDVTVLALPRGGVPVAFEVADALRAALDVLVVRKLGVPVQPELAMGAIASGNAVYLDERIVAAAGVTEDALDGVIARERAELERRETLYRGERPPLDMNGRVAIIVDDGLATGATMKAAALSLRHAGAARPARIVAALPVAPLRSEARFEEAVDDFVCVLRPPHFLGVGQFYADFDQTSDDEVRALLAAARST
ncbi:MULTISPECIES: phosphoribosyltransferase family protein [unclassified Caballeronia]|uniref:phosphoribosyltransferase n=1 Tax=unclassified Caballeronia TaxID=2646786 RepID=UPI002855BD53|nr:MULTISPECIES: phosphoribosyltransferase family protein [unclassified Caballeronia]MDR5775350.1 phosphoribosyltransferase family protein [Caballeronia sp. LZ002]MDR5850788.1 phosphoribosyltransferase family protein [Caballeronia sp. LZ003]